MISREGSSIRSDGNDGGKTSNISSNSFLDVISSKKDLLFVEIGDNIGLDDGVKDFVVTFRFEF